MPEIDLPTAGRPTVEHIATALAEIGIAVDQGVV
jgi:hypothetical protein